MMRVGRLTVVASVVFSLTVLLLTVQNFTRDPLTYLRHCLDSKKNRTWSAPEKIAQSGMLGATPIKGTGYRDEGIAIFNNSTVPLITDDASANEAERLFHKYVREVDAVCHKRERLGRRRDGGWNMCMSPPYTMTSHSCLIYSFGINNEWSFDDDVVEKYGCDLRAFDPSMHKEDHRRGDKIWFYNVGIGGSDLTRNARGWQIKTLGSFVKHIGDTSRVIDYLKIDVEYSEWDALETALMNNPTDHVLDRTKQLAIEIHTREVLKSANPPSTAMDYMRYMQIMRDLQTIGFRRWDTHTNMYPSAKYTSMISNQTMRCCYEIIFININYLKLT